LGRPRVYPPLFRTDGALAAAAEVGGVWRLVTWLRIFASGLRDPFYRSWPPALHAVQGIPAGAAAGSGLGETISRALNQPKEKAGRLSAFEMDWECDYSRP